MLREKHPRISVKDQVLQESKIILGSFPIWSIVNKFGESKVNNDVELYSGIKNEYNFFYGSSTNLFWVWYAMYIDSSIKIGDIKSIQESLTRNSIGITDVIFECERRGRSSLDKNLVNRVYNHNFFRYPKEGETIKILCTSKGVMNEMLLNNLFF